MMRLPSLRERFAGSLLVTLLCLSPASAATAGPRAELDASAGQRPAASTRARAAATRLAPALAALGTPASIDARYDVPTFLWADRTPGGRTSPFAARAAKPTAEAAARSHLNLVSGFYRLQPADAAEAPLRELHDTGRGGIIASFTQRVAGIDVFRDEVKVLMDRDLSLLAVAGYIPSRDLVAHAGTPVFALQPEAAVRAALDDFAGSPSAGKPVMLARESEGGYQHFDVSAVAAALPEGLQPGDAVRVKRTLFHLSDALVPAYYVEVMAPDQAYSYVVDASDGHLLFRHDLMAFDSFSYRVWAEGTGAHLPHDGPQGLAPTPHPTGLPDFFAPAFTAPNLLVLQNGPISTNDPWLPAGATVTTGNNVDAYADLATPDGFNAGDLRASTNAPNAFDRVYDVNQNPNVSNDQRMAAITQLFYNNNFFHDWYYDSGFNEASGNGQTDNFGRGGLGGDAMRSEAQDFGGTNNANMSTPADGSSGRMQMYLFSPAGVSQVQVSSPAGVAGNYTAGVSGGMGPQTFNVTGSLILGLDAFPPTGDGCAGLTNAAQVSGKIVMLDRGNCTNPVKMSNAQGAGAIGVILADTTTGGTTPFTVSGSSGTVTIPVLSVTLATANALKAALAGGPVTLTLLRQTSVRRDGSLDNQIVAHEWGHFISNRLVGNAGGLSTIMAGGLGEGWADFHAMMITARPEDAVVPVNAAWDGVFGLAGYALYPSVGTSNAYYFGIRRVPYSTDMAKNGLTFKHIQNGIALPVGPPVRFGADGSNNAEVHNTGEVWCTMLWECYAALLRDTGRLTFAQAQQRMRDYLVAAYKLTPNAPTLLEARDALLAAANASDSHDFQAFWTAFAKRGAGVSAVAPDRFDPINFGVVESFVTGGDLVVVAKALDVSIQDCDADGYLDNGEVGHVRLTLRNVGSTTLTQTSVALSSTNPHVGFPAGNTATVPALAPLQSTSVTLPVQLLGASGAETLDFVIGYTDAALAVPGVRTTTLFTRGNTDEIPAALDAFEALATPWSPVVSERWQIDEYGANDRRMHGYDVGDVSDHFIVTPPLQVSPSQPLTFSMQTRWDFERDATNNYDGGVVEVSTDGGTTWADAGIGVLAPGYGSVLFTGSGNPLSGRQAYVGQSASYPALTTVTGNFGT
ncbi:MAG: M36 family metallopeptidase, partial [Candidatus Eisenbacteria bacterium]